MKDPPKGLNNVRSELLSIISEKELIKGGDPFIGNLYNVSTTPFPTWGINPEHLISLLAGNLKIVTIFDPASFIWLGRSLGLDIGLSTRKEAAQHMKDLGKRMVPARKGDTF